MNHSILSTLAALVRTSTGWSLVLMNSNWISPSLTKSQIKWCLSSMCFVLAWKIGFLVIAIVDIISQQITVGSSIFCYKSESNLLSQIASHATSVATIYSTSIEEGVQLPFASLNSKQSHLIPSKKCSQTCFFCHQVIQPNHYQWNQQDCWNSPFVQNV